MNKIQETLYPFAVSIIVSCVVVTIYSQLQPAQIIRIEPTNSVINNPLEVKVVPLDAPKVTVSPNIKVEPTPITVEAAKVDVPAPVVNVTSPAVNVNPTPVNVSVQPANVNIPPPTVIIKEVPQPSPTTKAVRVSGMVTSICKENDVWRLNFSDGRYILVGSLNGVNIPTNILVEISIQKNLTTGQTYLTGYTPLK